jgi:REP element-mobilizing transposase RayT
MTKTAFRVRSFGIFSGGADSASPLIFGLRGYFVSTVGGAPLQVIKQYVEQQKD